MGTGPVGSSTEDQQGSPDIQGSPPGGIGVSLALKQGGHQGSPGEKAAETLEGHVSLLELAPLGHLTNGLTQ